MILRTFLAATVVVALASCSAFRNNQDEYDTGAADAGNPYGVPGYDTTGAEAGAYTPEGSAPANPTYAPAAYEENTAAPAAAAAGSKPAAASGAAGAKVHTVAKGDTLWGLSKKYGVSADAIKAANNMTKDTVVLGSKLKIPAH